VRTKGDGFLYGPRAQGQLRLHGEPGRGSAQDQFVGTALLNAMLGPPRAA